MIGRIGVSIEHSGAVDTRNVWSTTRWYNTSITLAHQSAGTIAVETTDLDALVGVANLTGAAVLVGIASP